MELFDPLIVNSQLHQAIRVVASVVVALQLGQVYLINIPTRLENGACLRMQAANDDCLVHTLESHSKEEESCDFDVTWQVDEDLTQCSDLLLPVWVIVSRTPLC